MYKQTIARHWHELRYHMVAGLIWYLVGLVTSAGIVSTFHFLRDHSGVLATIGIDLFAIIAVYRTVLYFLKLWKSTEPIIPSPDKFKILQVSPENSSGENVYYKNKVRIVLRNDTEGAVNIKNPVWVANGNVSLELPSKIKLQLEKVQGGWQTNQWLGEESEIYVRQGEAFRTWIGLHERLSDEVFGRTREDRKFGTLSLAISGYDDEVRIAV